MTTSIINKKPSLNPVLKEFWQTKADLKILKGGRASSKTWDAAGFAIFLACKYKVKFLCMRQFQNKIQESVYAILKIQIERFGLEDEFEILKTVIRHRLTGSEFHFYGIHRNIAEIKGFEGADIGWIEEAEGLTKEQWSIIEPTLRSEGAQAWFLYNPRLVSDFIETFKHSPDSGVVVKHINYEQNPFLSDTIIRKIKRLKDTDYDEYEHIYLGIARSDDERVIIKRSWIETCIDAHIKLDIDISGANQIGFDIADSGNDLCSQIHSKGILATWGENWKGGEDELLESCARVYNSAILKDDSDAHIVYDSIGVGASAGAKFNEMNGQRTITGTEKKVAHSKFIAGGAVVDPNAFYMYYGTEKSSIKNKDFFSNIKSQYWWDIGDRFMNTYNAITKGREFDHDRLISISSSMPNLDSLITQLSTPRRDFDKAGRVKVESKEDLAKRNVPSPNDADAFIMAMVKVKPAYNINAWQKK